MDLPKMKFDPVKEDPTLPEYPKFELDELIAIMDAAHGTDLRTRRSVMGVLIILAGAAVAYKSKLTSTVPTSSTEAEFLTAVFTAKIVKYFRYILRELRMGQPRATRMLIDNIAALMMINERRPTPRARHLSIQSFAIQEWKEQGDITMEHVGGNINAADDLTKALSWVLKTRHCLRAMGYYGPPNGMPVVDS